LGLEPFFLGEKTQDSILKGEEASGAGRDLGLEACSLSLFFLGGKTQDSIFKDEEASGAG